MKYVIARTYSAGVFAGYLESRTGTEAVLLDAIRIASWSVATSLIQKKDVKNPGSCKFAMPVDRVELTQVIEILDVPNDAIEKMKCMKYVIARTYSAGVFAGYLESRTGTEAVLLDAIRIWSWSGAASLSQLAKEGVKNPESCKFAMPVDRDELTQVIEILDVTEEARKNIIDVPTWKIK